jgi:DNA polymerase III gamma/tau subunit
LRDAQSLLDQVLSYAGENITIDQVRYILGAVPFEVLVGFADSIKKRDSKSVFNCLQKAVDSGYDVHKLADDLTALLREMFLLKIKVTENFQIAVTEGAQQELRSLAKDFTDAELEWAIEILTRTCDLMKWSEQPRLLLEINLYKLAQGYVPLEDVIARLDELAVSGPGPALAQRVSAKQEKAKKTAAQPDISIEYKSGDSGAAAVPDAFQKPRKESVSEKVDKSTPDQSPASGGIGEFQVEWKKFLEHLRHTRTMGPRIYACLIEAKASGETSGRINLEFPHEYHRKAIETSVREIEKEYQNFTGNKVRFICRLRPQKSSEPGGAGITDAEPPVETTNGEATQTIEDLLESEPRLKRMTELFKGEITSWEKKK